MAVKKTAKKKKDEKGKKEMPAFMQKKGAPPAAPAKSGMMPAVPGKPMPGSVDEKSKKAKKKKGRTRNLGRA